MDGRGCVNAATGAPRSEPESSIDKAEISTSATEIDRLWLIQCGDDGSDAVVAACEEDIAATEAPQKKGKLLIEKAKTHRRHGDLEAAVAAAEEATRLVPESADAWIELGYVRRAKGDIEGTLAAHTRARDAEPNNSRAVIVRLDALADAGRYEECLEDAVRAVELAPERSHTYALEAAQRAVALDPANEFGQLALVDALTALDRNGQAIDAYRPAEAAGVPDTLGRANALAWHLYLDGDYAEAAAIMEGWFAADPELGADQAYEADTFAHILAADSESERAVEMFLLAAKLSPEHAARYRTKLEQRGLDVEAGNGGLEAGLRACVATGSACRLFD